ncbi:uncharacterized protein LOC142354141 [Convolutriloba macropyga]|uniref:uncharacterized protein LOC142354141 n=1 Tax=Convolutriloba macropyga TaxID=536237 RepID=UPI003F5214BA
MEMEMASAVGKSDRGLLSDICPMKLKNWTNMITCDLETIVNFVDFTEACLDGFASFEENLFTNRTDPTPEQKEFQKLLGERKVYLKSKLKLAKQQCYQELDKETQRKTHI